MVFNTLIGLIGLRKLTSLTTNDRLINTSFRNKIGRIDKTPSRTPDSILLPPGGNGRLYGLVAVKDSCPVDGKITSSCEIQSISI